MTIRTLVLAIIFPLCIQLYDIDVMYSDDVFGCIYIYTDTV